MIKNMLNENENSLTDANLRDLYPFPSVRFEPNAVKAKNERGPTANCRRLLDKLPCGGGHVSFQRTG